MANDARTRLGLRPIAQPYGNIQVGFFTVDSSQAYYLYQPVKIGSNGGIVAAGSAANTTILGVIVGFMDTNRAGLPSVLTSLSRGPYLTASETSNYGVICTTDPNQFYMIEEGTGGTDSVRGSIGETYEIFEADSGDANSGVCRCIMTQSSYETATSGMIQLVELADYVNADGSVNTYGDNAKWIVRLVRPQYGAVATPILA